jgi:hypothetical protein
MGGMTSQAMHIQVARRRACTSQMAPTAAVPPHITAAVRSPPENRRAGGRACKKHVACLGAVSLEACPGQARAESPVPSAASEAEHHCEYEGMECTLCIAWLLTLSIRPIRPPLVIVCQLLQALWITAGSYGHTYSHQSISMPRVALNRALLGADSLKMPQQIVCTR